MSEDGTLRLGAQTLSTDVARRKVANFLTEGEKALGRRMAAVVALEYQKNGWPHFHPLLSIEGGLEGNEIRTLSRLWFEASGYNRLEVPHDVHDVVEYASKYLTKGLDRGDVLLWPTKGVINFPDRGRLFGRRGKSGQP